MTSQTTMTEQGARRPLRRHHVVALVTSGGLSAIAAVAAVTRALTGQESVFSADTADQRVAALAGIVHGLAYVALGFVLLAERPLFDRCSRTVRLLRLVLLSSFGVLAGLFLVVFPVWYLITGGAAFVPEDGAVAVVIAVVATAAFTGMLLGGLLLGLTQLRRATLGVGGRVLTSMAPVLGLTILLQVVAPDWSHPALLEAALGLGVSLVGVGTVARPRPRPAAS